MTCSGWHPDYFTMVSKMHKLHLKMPVSFLPCGCCSQPDSACCPGPVSGHCLPTFSSTLDPVSSPLLENSNVTFEGLAFLHFCYFIYCFLISLSPWSLHQSRSFSLCVLLFHSLFILLWLCPFFSTHSIPWRFFNGRVYILPIKIFILCCLLKRGKKLSSDLL